MSCKHEFESLRTADGSFCMTACRKCMKSTGEIETLFKAEQQIADLIQQQAAEIAKKDRMLERATWVLDRTGSCPKTCDLMRNLCAARACWLAWLEKEEQGVE